MNARSAEGQVSASTGGSAVHARSVEGAASASTGGNAASARSVEGAVSVSMGGNYNGATSRIRHGHDQSRRKYVITHATVKNPAGLGRRTKM